MAALERKGKEEKRERERERERETSERLQLNLDAEASLASTLSIIERKPLSFCLCSFRSCLVLSLVFFCFRLPLGVLGWVAG